MSTTHIGATLIELSDIQSMAVGGIITLAGHNYDARTGQELIVPSKNLDVYFCVKERVIDRSSGNIRTIPETENWNYLYPNEYDMTEELQPKDKTSNVPWTFRWQPTRERMPLFPEVGIYEVWFKFVTPNSNQDDIWIVLLVKVGQPSAPRRVDSV
jgi:hypothetical protein